VARINIEEKWWGDPRRQAICDAAGNSYMVDGIFLRIIKTAQEYIKEGSPIPKKLFSQFPHSILFVENGICEITDEGVWLDGAKKHLGWLAKRVVAGKNGGKQKSPAKREAALKREASKREIIEELDHKQNHNSTSKTTIAQASSSFSSSFSSSDSISGSSSFEKQGRAPSSKQLEAVANYPNEYFAIHEILKLRNVPENLTRVWLNTYADVEWVVGEVKKATAWEASHPKNRKIHFGAYLTNWMNRGWDKRPTQKQHSADVRESGNREALDKFKKNIGGQK